MDRVDQASLVAIGMHDPQRLERERTAVIKEAAPEVSEADALARAQAMIHNIQSGRVFDDEVTDVG